MRRRTCRKRSGTGWNMMALCSMEAFLPVTPWRDRSTSHVARIHHTTGVRLPADIPSAAAASDDGLPVADDIIRLFFAYADGSGRSAVTVVSVISADFGERNRFCFYYKSSLCIPEPVLRRVRERLFIRYQKSFPAPGSRGLPPPYPASSEIRALNMTHLF